MKVVIPHTPWHVFRELLISDADVSEIQRQVEAVTGRRIGKRAVWAARQRAREEAAARMPRC